jgi:tRNA nucleotidyltransferase (CCA-adding enzyme)
MSFLDKLAKIEALIKRASSEGERQAAQLAKERVLTKISLDQSSKPIEYRVSLASPWEKRLFVALCRKHGLQTYRYQRQKYTTARLMISKNMMDEILWPDYQRYSKMLTELIEEIMKDIISKIHQSDEEEVIIAGEIDIMEA